MIEKKPNVWRDPWHFLAFGCGLGTMPIAPGTFGSLLGLLYFWLMYPLGWTVYILLTIAATIFGVWLCGRVSDDLGVHDHGGIVWDEVVGIMLTFLYAPLSFNVMIVGFLLFRLFDIWKPWPICIIDKSVKGGLGIMLDDVVAALPSWFCLQVYIVLTQ